MHLHARSVVVGFFLRQESIERLRRDFDTATDMDRLLRWWWSDPFTRHIHPSSQITVPDFVRRRICEVPGWPGGRRVR